MGRWGDGDNFIADQFNNYSVLLVAEVESRFPIPNSQFSILNSQFSILIRIPNY
ncbi:MAG: hypothetical protein F6J94_30400 [Moorea sp. SIO1F2]|uniref:hypothetical protein n=1 Tax=Moorena sp. SIO1F2 TaxID=2607819 RepID=UPI0013B6A4FA|nr:hypothetical protein [Moorena sp. SIO1F2]NET86039.1 hypothetical protein [Moorena sp. SIO1F2]